MRFLYALIFIILLEIKEGKLEEKARKMCAEVEERIAGNECGVFPFEVAIPRAPRSIRECKKSKNRTNSVAKQCKRRNCSECGLVVKGNKAFEEHAFSRHEGMKLVPCEKCDMKFLKFEALYDHTRAWHKRGDKCKFCGEIYSLEALEEHEKTCIIKNSNKNEIKVTEREWPLPTGCELCDRMFSSHSMYMNHCRTSHPGEKLFQCRFCCNRFTSHKYLRVHLKKQHKVEMSKAREKPPMKYPRCLPYSCLYCDTVVKGAKKYEQHGKIYHPGRAMFKCDTCGKSFHWKNTADRHEKESHGEDKTCCRYCSKCYFRVDRMRVHEEACGRKRALMEARKDRAVNKKTNKDRMGRHYCDICRKTMYMLDNTFKQHVLTHDDFDYCDMCDHRFERKRYPDGLEKHMKMRHPLRDNVDALLKTVRMVRKFEIKEEIRNWEVVTGCQVKGYSTLTSEVVGKSEGDDDDASYRDHCGKTYPGEKLFPCHYCCNRFTSHKFLRVHLEKQHEVEMLKAREKPKRCCRGLTYSCPYCEIVVKGTGKYERHGKNYHPGRAMFKCDTCGEGFRRKNAADRHGKDKHGENKTFCRFCSKCYFRQDRMKEHENVCGRKQAMVEAVT